MRKTLAWFRSSKDNLAELYSPSIAFFRIAYLSLDVRLVPQADKAEQSEISSAPDAAILSFHAFLGGPEIPPSNKASC
jgi:hypothetical protein